MSTQKYTVLMFSSVLVLFEVALELTPAVCSYLDVSNFQAFFNFVDMKLLLQNFCVYHVNAPGQEEGAATLPET